MAPQFLIPPPQPVMPASAALMRNQAAQNIWQGMGGMNPMDQPAPYVPFVSDPSQVTTQSLIDNLIKGISGFGKGFGQDPTPPGTDTAVTPSGAGGLGGPPPTAPTGAIPAALPQATPFQGVTPKDIPALSATGAEGGPPMPTGQEGPTPPMDWTQLAPGIPKLTMPSGFGSMSGATLFPGTQQWPDWASPPSGELPSGKPSTSPPASAPPTDRNLTPAQAKAAGLTPEQVATDKATVAATEPGATPEVTTPGITTLRTRRAGGDVAMSLPSGATPEYMARLNKMEGKTQNPYSSAYGEGQFIDSTFKSFLKSQHPELANTPAGPQLNALKDKLGHEATIWYAAENAKELSAANIPVNDATLYGAHFLGPGGLEKVWNAPPNTPVSQLLTPKAISSNATLLSGKTAGEVKQFLIQSMHPLPMQPDVTAPPQMGQTPPTDFSRVRQMLDQSIPGASEYMHNVIGGLSSGAATVKANQPGSFAATLAAAGGAGSEAAGKGFASYRDAMYRRAGAEMPILSVEHQQKVDAANIAFANAKSQWEVINQNRQQEYQGKVAEQKFKAPQISTDANGVTIEQFNPETGQMEVRRIQTKDTVDKAGDLEKMLKATGMDPALIDPIKTGLVMQSYKNDPVGAKVALTQIAVRDIIDRGAGAQVFGKAYTKAFNAALEKLSKSAIQAGSTTKIADLYDQAQKEAAAAILADPAIQEDPSWAKRGSAHSGAARLLSENFGPKTQAPKPQLPAQPTTPQPERPAPPALPATPREEIEY
jgi:hypothetical protein